MDGLDTGPNTTPTITPPLFWTLTDTTWKLWSTTDSLGYKVYWQLLLVRLSLGQI